MSRKRDRKPQPKPEQQPEITSIDLDSEVLDQYKNEVLNTLLASASLQQQIGYQDGMKYGDHSIGYLPSYDLLRRAGQHSVALMIKQKRTAQLAKFAKGVDKEVGAGAINKTGFNLVFKDGHIPTKREREQLDQWERVIEREAFIAPFSVRPSMLQFMAAAYRDFFDLDAIALQKIRGLYGRPRALTLNDSATIYPVIHPADKVNQNILLGEIRSIMAQAGRDMSIPQNRQPDYIQLIDRLKVAEFYSEDLEVFHLNRTSDYRRSIRGYGVVEQAATMLGYLSGMLSYNASNFNETKIPNGLLVLKGAIGSSNLLETLKRMIHANQTDPRLKNRIVSISMPKEGDAQWLNLKNTSKDEEFHQFWVLIGTIFCQIAGIAPLEVGLPSYSQMMRASALNDTADDGIIRQSSDEGARLFLTHLQTSINQSEFIEAFTSMPVELQFVGFESQDAKGRQELNELRLRTGDASINDLRIESGLDKAKNPVDVPGIPNIYDIPGINNQFIQQFVSGQVQNQMQMQMQQQQMQMQGQQPQPGEQQQPDGQADDVQELTPEDLKKLKAQGISEEEARQALEEYKASQQSQQTAG